MTTAVQRRRGTTTEHASFTGLEGEISVNTTKETLVVHDGSTAGGFELARADGSNFVATSVDINGGTIDGTTIGASSASTGAFTTLTASGEITANGGIALGDNDKATFGAGDDLQIYHDGSSSFIKDAGTGNLIIQATDLQIANADNTANYIRAFNGGAVDLRYAGAAKLATTSTGIDVTGTATMDGLVVNVNNDIQISRTGTSSQKLFWDRSGVVDGSLELGADENLTLSVADDGRAGQYIYFNNNTKRVMSLADGGDVSFYEDTGTTAKFFWDASAESLGIGTAPDAATVLHVQATEPQVLISDASSPLQRFMAFDVGLAADEDIHFITVDQADGLAFGEKLNGNDRVIENEWMRITNAGNVGIGTSAPTSPLTIKNSTDGNLIQLNGSNNAWDFMIKSTTPVTNGVTYSLGLYRDDGATNPNGVINFFRGGNEQTGFMSFDINGSEALRIDSSGNLLVGTTDNTVATKATGEGFYYNAGFNMGVARSAGTVAQFNRQTNDGDIIEFRKDGTTVGSIGSVSGYTHIANNGDTGLRFAGTDIRPCTSSGADSNGFRDLGDANARFKDLYLSGGVYLGGTGAANLLDDYEEGTWTPVASNYSGTMTINRATYEKIGRQITVRASVSFDGTADGSNAIIAGLPFSIPDSDGGAAGMIGRDTSGNCVLVDHQSSASIQFLNASSVGISYSTIGANTIEFTHIYYGS